MSITKSVLSKEQSIQTFNLGAELSRAETTRTELLNQYRDLLKGIANANDGKVPYFHYLQIALEIKKGFIATSGLTDKTEIADYQKNVVSPFIRKGFGLANLSIPKSDNVDSQGKQAGRETAKLEIVKLAENNSEIELRKLADKKLADAQKVLGAERNALVRESNKYESAINKKAALHKASIVERDRPIKADITDLKKECSKVNNLVLCALSLDSDYKFNIAYPDATKEQLKTWESFRTIIKGAIKNG